MRARCRYELTQPPPGSVKLRSGGSVLVELVDVGLERLDVARFDARLLVAEISGQRREQRAEVEQLVLRALEQAVDARLGAVRAGFLAVGPAHQSEDRVELVDGAVGFDARRILGDHLAADQGGLTLVANLGVDAAEVDGHGRRLNDRP